MKRSLVAAIAVILLVPATAAAQKTGVAVTPFFGLTLPGKALLLRPGLNAATDAEKQALLGVIGGRITIGLTEKFEIEGEVGYGSSGLKVASLSAPSGTDASVLTLSGLLVYRTKPAIEPFSLALHGGLAAVHRAFSERSGTITAVTDKTNVGAQLGAEFNFRASRRAAVVIGLDDFLYNASFAVAATGSQPKGITQSLTQNDLRVTLGFRVAVAGH